MASSTAIKLKSGKDLPAHVPASLVREVSQFLRPNTSPDPYASTKEVFETFPRIFFSPEFAPGQYDGTWVVTHYEDIRDVYQTDALYSTAESAGFQTLIGETFRMIPLAIDPPEHGKYRVLLNPWFSPKAITALEPKILATINVLIDEFWSKGGCDVAYDFGRIYPVRVFMDLMGFPPEQLEEFLAWEYAILHGNRDVERMKWGIGSAVAYLRGFIDEMRRSPAENLTSHIVHGEVEGRPLTDDEIIGTVAFLWLGGLDTVAASTSLMFRRLALDPDLQQRLRENPDLIADAVEEFLRLHPLVNSVRLVKQDHEIHGVQIKRGDHIMCYNATGNFDPSEFENPREFDLDRANNRHFTLAGGPHRCLGSHLARRELRLALSEFLRRIPAFRIKPGADLTTHPGLMAVARLPVVWDAGKALSC
ncbi:cytochrome P450 [Phenylobacterium sp. LjRoot219]|uniref:cytochrome P450 n=1 Tax=Phenylobacterium sp. LjRoot219 TaxID=3342283 RepID=UPI003ECE8D5B